MQRLEVSGAVRPLYGSLGVKGLSSVGRKKQIILCPAKEKFMPAVFWHYSLKGIYTH